MWSSGAPAGSSSGDAQTGQVSDSECETYTALLQIEQKVDFTFTGASQA